MTKNDDRSINWIDSTHRSLHARFRAEPEIQSRCEPLVERLAALLLERLPAEIASGLFDLLPRTFQREPLARCARGDSDRTIGFPDFMEEAEHVLTMEGLGDIRPKSDEEERDIPREIADAFLWAVVQEVPPEMKTRMAEALPTELKSRMDLYSSKTDDARVA